MSVFHQTFHLDAEGHARFINLLEAAGMQFMEQQQGTTEAVGRVPAMVFISGQLVSSHGRFACRLIECAGRYRFTVTLQGDKDFAVSLLDDLERAFAGHLVPKHDAWKRTAIHYWEQRRILYNVALIPPALFGYFLFAGISAGVGDPRRLSTGAIIALFLVSAAGANLCYTIGYAFEFLFGSDAPESRWVGFWRPMLVVLGTLCAMVLALVGGRNIAALEYSFQ